MIADQVNHNLKHGVLFSRYKSSYKFYTTIQLQLFFALTKNSSLYLIPKCMMQTKVLICDYIEAEVLGLASGPVESEGE